MFETILYEVKEQIAYLVFNRPEHGNAFSDESFEEIPIALEKAAKDERVRAIVLTGKGKMFCAGGDINQFKEFTESENSQGLPESMVIATGKVALAIRACPKPVIASINGAAAGAGMGVALACDFRIMEKKSSFVTAFINMAFPGDTGVLYFLQQMVGTAVATELMMFSEPIRGERAVELGLANLVVDNGMLEEETLKFSRKVASLPTLTVEKQKQLLNEFFYRDLERFTLREAELMNEASKREDHKEAVNAFLEKRKPNFLGK